MKGKTIIKTTWLTRRKGEEYNGTVVMCEGRKERTSLLKIRGTIRKVSSFSMVLELNRR